MDKSTLSRILIFVILSYTIALILDVIMISFYTPMILWLWGSIRMWSVALSVVICLIMFKEDVVSRIKWFLKLSKRVVVYYLLAPTIAYLALGVYVAITMPLGLFNFDIYVDMLTETIKAQIPSMSDVELKALASVAAYSQLFLGYVAAISINALFALGEEIGWRGYLYHLLGSRPSIRSIVVVGALWGLWHASAIAILGYDYPINRLLGIALFTMLTIATTFPHLLLVTVSSSIIPAASLHGAINALWSLTVVASNLPLEQREVLLGLGAIGIITWTIITIALHLTTQRIMHGHQALMQNIEYSSN
ncbi:MAG: CPBP family intramembrane glutamic endopeptidase [Candidatus Nezhaarchaeales archaeon]